jgi:phage terminase large subunit-like protein
MRDGPKVRLTAGALDLSRLPKKGGSRAVAFLAKFILIPKGTGALRPIRLGQWQKDIVHGLFDEPRPRQGLVSMPRGNGKSTLAAALAVYGLFADLVDGSASVLCLASTEKQARIVFDTARRMIELSPVLAARCQIFADKIVVPATDSTLQPLPALPDALQGYDPTLAICDELHVMHADSWAAMLLAGGKRRQSLVLAISTPAGDTDGVMYKLAEHGRSGLDPAFYYREHAAPEGCDLDDEESWHVANPALGVFLHIDGLRSTLGKTSESNFRRYRLGQWAQPDEAWMPRAMWDSCADPESLIEEGASVCLGFDGSVSGDATALVAVSTGTPARVELVAIWERDDSTPEGWKVDKVAVENAIRRACQRWQVAEIAADEAWYHGMLERLLDEGFPIVKFPQTAARMAPATTKLFDAVAEQRITHNGDPRLARHITNAVAKVEARGVRLVKEFRRSTKHIDAAIALVMAFERSTQAEAEYDLMKSFY